ncbi:MAG TPA: hypothetical protein VF541_21940 [Longimicrobium sp.]|jgi:hypothetical protein
MPSPVSLWFERLPEEVDRRLERAEALAREDLIETHAQLASDLIGILAPRMAFDEAIERYLESMGLEGEDAEAVGTRAVALMDEQDVREDLAREGTRGWGFNWRYATPLGALRFIQRQKKRSDEERLWLELAAARAEEKLADAHARHAQEFVGILDEEVDPARAVELYVERLNLPEVRARIVYQRVLARLAESELPRLHEDEPAAPPPAAEAPATGETQGAATQATTPAA